MSIRIWLLLLVVLFGYIVSQIVRTKHLITVGDELAAKAVPFSRSVPAPSLRILIVGDSTGVGTGASASSTSLAGLVGARYPNADIQNKAVNGAKTAAVLEQLEKVNGSFDLVLIHVGGNDNVRFTSLNQLRTDIRSVLAAATQKGSHVLLTTTGNVGTVPLFPAPTRWIFAIRTKQVHKIFMEEVAAAGESVRYIDLFRERAKDPFAIDPNTYYAADSFHPSDAGYADWFQLLSKELDQFDLK